MRKLTRREAIAGGAASVAALALAATEGCDLAGNANNNAIPAPGVDSYTLTVQYADHTYNGMILRTRTYDGQIPGPTLETGPGRGLNITVRNQLPPNPVVPVPQSALVYPAQTMEEMMEPPLHPLGRAVRTTHIDPMNNPHLFNTTNLHVHGLQVVPHIFEPVGTSDPSAMMKAIDPGASATYNFTLPGNHPPGLYWYHPHHHGSTDVEVSGGMAGLILVRGSIDFVPEIAAARDIHVAIQTLQVNPDASAPGVYSTEYIAYKPPNQGGYTPRSAYIVMLVNGQLINVMQNLAQGSPTQFTSQAFAPPVTTVQPGEVVRLRLLNGTQSLNLPLQLPGFEVYVIGYDGVNLDAPKKIDQTGSGAVPIAAANRVELLVRAPAVPGTFMLSALPTVETLHPWPQFNLMQFVVAGAPVSMNVPARLPIPVREYPPIADSEIAGTRSVVFNASASTSILSGTALTVNGAVYNEMGVLFNLQVGTAEQWTISNQMPEGHPFHLHTNSFEVHTVTDSTGAVTTHVPPVICDTVWVPANGQVVMRVRYKEWRGKDVFHCHKLAHEDQGMMANTMLQ